MTGRACLVSTIGFLGLLFSGCAAYRAENVRPITPWPPVPRAKRPTIGLLVRSSTTVNGVEQGTSLKDLRAWRKQVITAYVDSGLFSQVTAGSIEVDPETGRFLDTEAGLGQPDLRAEVEIISRQEANWTWCVLTGLTVYLVPSRVTNDFVIKTTIKDDGARTLGQFEVSDTVYVWQQLFLVFVMPFSSPWSVEERTLYDLGRATILEARDRGAF